MTQHPSRQPRSRRRGIGFAALATLALALLAPTSSALATAGSGQVVVSLSGKADGSLLGNGVKLTYTAKAGKTGATKSAASGKAGKGGSQGALPVVDLELVEGTTIHTVGALKLRSGKRLATLRAVTVQSGGAGTALSATLGKQRLVVFRAQGAVAVNGASVTLSKAPLSLTGKGADALGRRLGLDGLSGPQGTLGVNAQLLLETAKPQPTPKSAEPEPKGPGIVDPYLQQCGVSATSEVAGSLPDATALPSLADAKDTVAPGEVTWGFKIGFRSYVVFGAGGTLGTLDGASTNGGPPVISSFDFPVTAGEYAGNDPVDMTDDQAVVEGSGKALFCATGHGFRVVISNPTVIIDGENSRIVADIDTNLTGVWTPEQRIDLADLDVDGITPFYNVSGSEVSWGQIPATLTEAGADAICGGGACSYEEGTALDSIDVAVKTAYETGAGDAAAWDALATYVGAELPFPLPNPAQGGCTLPGTAGGSAAAARTIDEHVSYGGTTSAWNPNGARPAAQPDLSADTAVTAGSFDWGLRRSLRGSLNATGDFNLFGGTTASDPYFGNGGSLPSRPSQMSNTAGTQSKYFRWPASGGYYEANGAGNADDRLVLQTSGRVAFCQVQAAQQYATVLSDPAIVIDGANSRVTVDVATRYRLSWVRGRVDVASLDLTDPGVTVAEGTDSGTTTVEWKFPDANETVTPNVGPVELTKAGEAVVNMISKAGYVEGLGLDGVTIKASFPAGP